MSETYYHFFCVRDSENSIDKVMNSLVNQTFPPSEIIVVEDGSTDRTSEILTKYENEYSDFVKVIHTDSKTRDYTRIPRLWNMCLKKEYDYHMIGAGDTIFEKDYSEKLMSKLKEDPQLVICSGGLLGERAVAPHGGGRFVRQSFFYKYYKKYPEIIGYESEILMRALTNGYKISVIHDAIIEHTTKLGTFHNFEEFGKGMKALGYHPLYVIGRCFIELLKNENINRRGVFNMFWQYLTYKPQSTGYFSMFPEDIRKKVKDYQGKRIRKILFNPKKVRDLV